LNSLLVALFIGYARAQFDSPNGPSMQQGGGGSMWMRRRAYPPMLDPILGEEAKERLNEISQNQQLSWEERRQQIDAVLDTIPPSQLARMPMPPGFEKLPTGVYDQIKAIHTDDSLNWSERRQRIRTIMHSIPPEQRRSAFKDMWFPPMPPPGFESVLAPTVYQQLVAVHQNSKLTVPEKKRQVDRIMQQVPADQLARLPLPPLMRQLPAGTQQRIRSIMHNYRTPWEERHKMVRAFMKTLPAEEKRLMRPPLPPFMQQLPADARARIEAIHNNDDLGFHERFRQFREVMESLPEEVRAQIQQPRPQFPWQQQRL